MQIYGKPDSPWPSGSAGDPHDSIKECRNDLFLPPSSCIPKDPCTQTIDTLAPKYPNRDNHKAKVSTWTLKVSAVHYTTN